MKGSPMQRNFGIGSPLAKDENVKKGDDLTVTNWKKADADSDKMRRTIASEGGAAGQLTKRYGGEWSKSEDRYGNSTWRNQNNQTVKEAEEAFLNPS